MPNLAIRSADTADIKAIATLHVESWTVAYAPILTQKHLDWVSTQREVRRTRAMLKSGTPILVAQRADEVVGFMVYDDASEEDVDQAPAIEILSLWVHHEYTRQGIGGALLQEMLRRAVPPCVYVWVLTGVEAGPAFYEKRGFKPEERTRKDFVFLDEPMPMVRYSKKP